MLSELPDVAEPASPGDRHPWGFIDAPLGEADAAFAYASDVTPGVRDEVEVIEIPARLNVTAEYPVAVTQDSEEEDLAGEWVGLVRGERGQEILGKWGFEAAQ